MKYLFLIVLLAAIRRVLRLQAHLRAVRSPAARSFEVRMTLFSAGTGILFAIAFFLIPGPPRLLVAVPAFLAFAAIRKTWDAGRLRIHESGDGNIDFEKLKSVRSRA